MGVTREYLRCAANTVRCRNTGPGAGFASVRHDFVCRFFLLPKFILYDFVKTNKPKFILNQLLKEEVSGEALLPMSYPDERSTRSTRGEDRTRISSSTKRENRHTAGSGSNIKAGSGSNIKRR